MPREEFMKKLGQNPVCQDLEGHEEIKALTRLQKTLFLLILSNELKGPFAVFLTNCPGPDASQPCVPD